MVGRWNIDVGGTRGVISAAASSIAGLDAPLTGLNVAVAGVAGAVPSAVVRQALENLVEVALVPAVRGVVAGSTAVLTGTSEAVDHYASGDLVMAANAARSTAAAPVPVVRGGLRPLRD